MKEQDEDVASSLPTNLDTLQRLRGFRLRGLEMTRLEAFVDAAFAFAVTMLVIAGQEVPSDIPALLATFRDVPAFGASIAILAIFWRGHWLWSRRYGLEDNFSIVISWTVIFVMLVYVYPLKVVMGGMFYALSEGRVGLRLVVQSIEQGRALFAVYGAGFSALAFLLVLLNLHAWRLRDALRLDRRERELTRQAIFGWSAPMVVGLVSLTIALLAPRKYIAWSGWVYFSMVLLGPARWLLSRRRKRKMGSIS